MKKFISSIYLILFGLSYTHAQEETYEITRTLNFSEAMHLKNHRSLGIKGIAEDGTVKIEIIPAEMTDDYVLPNQNILHGGIIYGTEFNNRTESSFVEFGWTLTWDQIDCSPFQNAAYNFGNTLGAYYHCLSTNKNRSRLSTNYKGALLRSVEHAAIDGEGDFFSFNASEIDVRVVLTITGSVSLQDLTFNLPGLGQLSGSTFLVSPSGNVDLLFNDDWPMVVSHRGNWEAAGVPENSQDAMLESERDSGVDWLEIDIEAANVQLNTDGTLQSLENFVNHDDFPHRLLAGSFSDETTVYDLTLDEIQEYSLNDRFGFSGEEYSDIGDAEAPMSMSEFFTFVKNNITKPINLDIGSKPYLSQRIDNSLTQEIFDSTFVQAVRDVSENDLNDQIIFKYTYTYDAGIWDKVMEVLNEYGKSYIFYTPKMITDQTSRQTYFDNWVSVHEAQNNDNISAPANGSTATSVAQVVGFEVRIKVDDGANLESVEALHTYVTQATAAGIPTGIFSEGTAACEGTWNNQALKKYVDFSSDYRNSIEWLTNLGYGYIITDYPQHLVDYKDRAYNHELSTSATSSWVSEDMSEATNAAFSLDMVIQKSTFSSPIVLAELQGEKPDGSWGTLWKFGINNDQKFYVSRLLYGTSGTSTTESYRGEWDVTFWEPRLAPFGNLNDDEALFVGIIVEHLETRLHIGTPDGVFDCMYLDYGAKHTVLSPYIEDITLSNSGGIGAFSEPDFEIHINNSSEGTVYTYGVNQAFCRTDMFKRALDTYFNAIDQGGNLAFVDESDASFSFLNDDNPYYTTTGTFETLNNTIYADDINRLGNCTYDRTVTSTGFVLTDASNFDPDPNLVYHIDSHGGRRLAATGTSEDAYTTTTDDTSEDTRWKFVDNGSGYWHIDLATEDTSKDKIRLRTDETEFADMESTSSNDSWTYYTIEPSSYEDAHHFTLVDATGDYTRLHISAADEVKMVSEDQEGETEAFFITEYQNDDEDGSDPSDIIDLTAWKITWPLDENGDDNSDETSYSSRNDNAYDWPDADNDLIGAISAPFDEYMYVSEDDNDEVRFKAHVGGATTEGSGYPRSELRQLVGGGDNYWDADDYQYLEVRARVTNLPDIKPEVCMVQIHGPENEPLRIEYDAESSGLHITKNDELADEDSNVLPYSLGEQLFIRVTVEDGEIDVVIVNESRPIEDPWTSSWASDDDTGFFKVGCYTQSSNVLSTFKSEYTTNPDPTEYGEVAIKDLTLIETYNGSARIVQDALIEEKQDEDFDEDKALSQSLVYPNPSSGVINIKVGSEFENDEHLKLHLYDLKGVLKLSHEVDLKNDMNQEVVTWDTTTHGGDLETGMYFLSISGQTNRLIGRVAMDCGCNK